MSLATNNMTSENGDHVTNEASPASIEQNATLVGGGGVGDAALARFEQELRLNLPSLPHDTLFKGEFFKRISVYLGDMSLLRKFYTDMEGHVNMQALGRAIIA